MASLIDCPHCGQRPKEEFTIKGDAGVQRPAPGSSEREWFDYVYQRENPRGAFQEFWHHSGGCRRWLVVARDTVTHEVFDVTDASERATR
jgi:methylglutamate dehydrogenase subunit B